jgi:hypothetical protein
VSSSCRCAYSSSFDMCLGADGFNKQRVSPLSTGGEHLPLVGTACSWAEVSKQLHNGRLPSQCELARTVWSPTTERNLFHAFTPYAHFHLKRIAAEFYPKVFQRNIDKNKKFVVLFVKACLAHHRKLPVNWAQFAVEMNARMPAFKPHPQWCTLEVEDDVSNGLKMEGVYDNMLVLDSR